MERFISPVHNIRGSYTPPGDKSISHRALILAAMAEGSSTIANCAAGEDLNSTKRCLGALGVHMDAGRVEGRGRDFARGTDPLSLDARNSGTTMRLLMGALAATPRDFVLSGDESLRARPMDRVADPLSSMGAEVELSADRYPPVRLRGAQLKGISYASKVASAQVKGAVLLAALQAEGKTKFREPWASRDHTERLLAWLGAGVSVEDGVIEATAGTRWTGFHIDVPGDFSSAAYLLVAACLSNEGDLNINGVGLNPSRAGLLDVMKAMGAHFEVSIESADPEPVGSIHVRASSLKGVDVTEPIIPRVIDELPLIALAATFAEGRTVVSGAAELRVKEADRITALVTGLRALGAAIEETNDGFVIDGPTQIDGGEVESKADHRLALTFATAGLVSREGVHIEDWEAVDVSYPEFEQDLATVTGR